MNRPTTLMDNIWQGFKIILPLYPNFSMERPQIYQKSIFKEMQKTNTSWNDLHDMLEDFKNLRNTYVGCNLGNNCFQLQRGEKFFVFSLHKDYNYQLKQSKNNGEFCLWNDMGCTALGGIAIPDMNVPPSNEFINWINTTTLKWVENKIHCSGCGKLMPIEEIAGSYFAGRYCKDCWENKWKAIEATETYE